MNVTQIKALLRKTAVFADLSPEITEQVLLRLQLRSLEPGEYLVQEGDPGDTLFLIVSGSLTLSRIQADATSTATIALGTAGPGEVFGELGLLTGHPAVATMQAITASSAAVLTSEDFDELCAASPEGMAPALAAMAASVDAYQIASAAEESGILRGLSVEARRELAATSVRIDLPAGQTLFREGDEADALYLVLSGRVRLQRERSAGAAEEDGGRRTPGSRFMAEPDHPRSIAE